MALDVVDLREFYISPLGHMVRRALRERLAFLWPDVTGETILALGYATPLLRPWLGRAQSIMALMPDHQGVAYWPREGPNCACLADLTNMPLADESVSRIVCLHALENMPSQEAFLREAWRVLQPGGRMIVVVPHRRGVWSHRDTTPFGSGNPFSLRQICTLLREQGFSSERAVQALYFPPCSFRFLKFLFCWIEGACRALYLPLGGVWLIEAGKQLYTPTPIKMKKTERRLVVPLPFPTSSGALPM